MRLLATTTLFLVLLSSSVEAGASGTQGKREAPSLHQARAAPNTVPQDVLERHHAAVNDVKSTGYVRAKPKAKTPAVHHSKSLPELDETNDFPLGLCEGECDSDDDCQDGLICFQRDENEAVPGCSGGLEDWSRSDYCIEVEASIEEESPDSAASGIFPVVSAWLGSSGENHRIVGKSVALSGDGNSFAYGLFSETIANTVLLGDTRPDISGSAIGDEFGFSISLSHDGQIIAIGIPNSREGAGSVKVYAYNETGSSWTQMGGDLVGSVDDSSAARFGHSVSLSNDGYIVAVGQPGSSSVSVFIFQNNTWLKMGEDITVSVYLASYHGWCISLSGDGSVLAIGAPTNEENWDEAGACRIYEYTPNGWEPRGDFILGEQRHGLLGSSVSLSDDGNTVAVGSINFNTAEESGEKAGAVFVYEYSNEGEWKRVGGDIFGDNAFDRLGRSVSLTMYGDQYYLAVGTPDVVGGGHVRVYALKVETERTYWELLEDIQQRNDPYEIDGKHGGFGTTVALAVSSDGLRMAVGAPYTRSDERLGLIPIQVGEVSLWQE